MTIQRQYVIGDKWIFYDMATVAAPNIDEAVWGNAIPQIRTIGEYLIVDGVSVSILYGNAANTPARIAFMERTMEIMKLPTLTCVQSTRQSMTATQLDFPLQLKDEAFFDVTWTAVNDTIDISMWGHWAKTTKELPFLPQPVEPIPVDVSSIRWFKPRVKVGPV